MSKAVAGCVLAGLVLRLAFALCYWHGQPLTHDEREYLALGRSVARGEGFTYPADEPAPGTGQRFGRAPGYPLFLAALHVTEPVDHAPRRVQIAQACLGALGIWLVAAIAARAGGPRAAVVAAAVAAVYPPLVAMPAYMFSETLFSTLALAAALALQRGARREAEGAILTAASILTRPMLLFFVPLEMLWLAWRGGIVRAVLFCALVIACIVPWTIRNHGVSGRWIAIASEGGVTFWTGNHPLAIGEGDFAANPDLKRDYLALRSRYPALREEQMEPVYYGEALAWIRAHPWRWLTLEARKLFYLLVPIGPSYRLHSLRYYAASAVSYALLLPAALIGAWRMGARRRLAPGLWLLGAAAVVASLVFFPQERFRIPVIDPVLVVCAGALFPFEEVRRDAVRRTT
jgi:4-amino-4-deoxy-L-arabinose transferase-like glycosyltransferase